MSSNDPYKTLGLSRNASTDEVKAAYRKLAMKHHPDRGGDEEQFKKITDAYNMIKDGPPAQGPFGPRPDFDFNFNNRDEIDEFLRRYRNTKHTMQVGISLQISFKDSVLGGNHVVRIPVNGQNQNFQINIPVGVTDGEKIRYPQLAQGSDVIITFHVTSDPNWKVEGLNLIKGVDVPIWDLILGAALNVQLIDGSTIRLKIPAGTQPATHMRIKGKGIQSRQNYLQKGDMLVRLDAKIPSDIPETLLAEIRKLNS